MRLESLASTSQDDGWYALRCLGASLMSELFEELLADQKRAFQMQQSQDAVTAVLRKHFPIWGVAWRWRQVRKQ